MATRFRRLFSRDKTSQRLNNETRPLTTQSYDSATARQAPLKGSYPVRGNGTATLRGHFPTELTARQSAQLTAGGPDAPRARSRSDVTRPLTAPQNQSFSLPAQFEVHGRTRSGLSTRLPLSRRGSVSSAYDYARTPSLLQSANSIGPLPLNDPYTPQKMAHVDILQAATYVNLSRDKASQIVHALGERDYGEDVADRNIANSGELDGRNKVGAKDYGEDVADRNIAAFGGYELKYAYLHAAEMEDEQDGSGLDAVGESDYRGDGTGDDISPQPPHTKLSNVPATIKPSHNPASKSPNPTNPPLGSQIETIPNTSNGIKGASSHGPAPVPVETGSDIDALGPSTSAVSPVSHGPSHKRNDSALSDDSDKVDLTAMSASTVRDFQEKKMSVPPGKLTPPVSRFSKQNVPPTPPISPARGDPTSSLPRKIIEQELSRKPGIQLTDAPVDLSVASHELSSRSVGGSRASRAQSDVSDTTIRPHSGKRDGRVFGQPSSDASLNGVVDQSNAIDTDVVTTQSPAIVHEYVMPRVHHVTEERITRESHNHDVFHRIQPVIDVEILPTKHYIPSPNGNGLVEIPASAIPGRRIDYETRPVSMNGRLPNSNARGSKTEPPRPHSSYLHRNNRDPIMTDTHKSLTATGYPRQETTWRHPARRQTGAYETGQTTPLNFFYDDDDDDDDDDDNDDDDNDNHDKNSATAGDTFWDASSEQESSTHGDEEELLFKDSEQAFGGRLPGLDDFNPAVQGTLFPSHAPPVAVANNERPVSRPGLPPISEKGDEESLKAKVGQQLQQQAAEIDPVTRKMERLRVGE